ncbi:MAG TPA: winged helix DNA-binding domain-containing protein [Methylomirabilota bacterium]|nr:winged helix DNA-binding domain-containing protein [Methylomirabilota bacterium]
MDPFAQRLRTQRLAGSPLPTPEAVVAFLGAVQSQDYPGAKWSLGQRVQGATDGSIDRAFDEGRILRTHVLRPTWHFVTPDDIGWLLGLTGRRVLAQCAPYFARLELDRAIFRRARAAIERALRGGRYRTRAEIGGVLREAGIRAGGQRLAHIMAEAELTGLVCSGARRGGQHTYALLEERAPGGRRLERDEALGELTWRFFRSHGPATLRHYAWWAGLTLADARAGLDLAGSRLERIEIKGISCWLEGGAHHEVQRTRTAFFIPEYDEAVLGYKEPPLPDHPPARGKTRWRARWPRPLVIGARRAGTWRRTLGRDAVLVETDLFAALETAGERAIQAAAERYARFLQRPLRLIVR